MWTVRGVSEKGNGSVFEGNMFKLRYFNRYQLYLCNNASRKNLFEVTKRTVTASVLCFAARKLNKFCEYLNLPGLCSETFKTHCDVLYQLTPRLKEHVVELAVQAVREVHKDMLPNCVGDGGGGGGGGITDIAVSYDGTWHTR